MESCHWLPGTAVENPAISAAVGIRTGGSRAAGLAGRAAVGRGFQISAAEETELGEGPLQGEKIITFKFFLG